MLRPSVSASSQAAAGPERIGRLPRFHVDCARPDGRPITPACKGPSGGKSENASRGLTVSLVADTAVSDVPSLPFWELSA
jgi:hypothetical protein